MLFQGQGDGDDKHSREHDELGCEERHNRIRQQLRVDAGQQRAETGAENHGHGCRQ